MSNFDSADSIDELTYSTSLLRSSQNPKAIAVEPERWQYFTSTSVMAPYMLHTVVTP